MQFLLFWGPFKSVLLDFLDLVSHHAWKWSHQKMELMDTWNNIYLFFLLLDSLLCTLAVLFTACCHDPYHFHHNWQLTCHQPSQIHLGMNILSIFLWNLSAIGATPNDSLLYQYLPKWYMNVVKNGSYLSSLMLKYLELALKR